MAKEPNQSTPTDSVQDALASYKAAHDGKAPPSTKGEKIFNALNYWGLGWVVNTVISLYWADAAEHTYAQPTQNRLSNWFANRWPFKKVEEKFTHKDFMQSEELYQALKAMPEYEPIHKEVKASGKGINEFFKQVGTPSDAALATLAANNKLGEKGGEMLASFERLKAARLSKYSAGKVVGFAMLNIGGWLLLAPMKLLEDRKDKIVPKLDAMLGSDKTTGEAREALQARHEELKHEPKQTWASELLARTISTPLIVGLYYNTNAKRNILSRAGIPFEGSDYYADKFAARATKALRGESQEMTALEKKLGEGTAKVAASMKEKGQSHLFNEASGSKRLHNIFSLGSLDVAYSAVMATLVFCWSRVTGSFLGEKRQPEAAPSVPLASKQAESAPPATKTVVVHSMAIDVPKTTVNNAQITRERASEKAGARPDISVMASHVERAKASPEALETVR